MNRKLILIIAIFSFWLYIYLTNIAEEQKAEERAKSFVPADDNIQYTNVVTGENVPTTNGIPDITQMRKKSYITNPVKAKGEA